MVITRTDIINLLFKKYNLKSYLEIGARFLFQNFDKINATLKHSVDPNPRYKYTYNVTSNEFFKRCVQQKYDLIFIDGLHLEDQVYIDAKNSINFLNENGFIVMHDCNPLTKYAVRSYEEFLKCPDMWNGTVYKAYIRLKDWSCFVVNEDHGCSVLTKRAILKNKLLDINISNMSWDLFDKNRVELLQLISFNEFAKLS